MQHFTGKVAVITGAASGIGRALALRCAQEGMRVVLADVEAAALAAATDDVRAAGAEALTVPTDVADAGAVEALAQRTFAAFGAVHLLCNNAGVVGGSGATWEHTLADWQWTLGVNLWGVVHSLRAFVPALLAQDAESHIVNTASILGLESGAGNGPYRVSKHAVVALSEVLYLELAAQTDKVKVSVLCPGYVETRISLAERNRPAALRNDGPPAPPPGPITPGGMPPAEVAAKVFAAVRAEQFYIVTHDDWLQRIGPRLDALRHARNPARR